MFFKVIDTSRVDGKTRITVEAEDPAVQILLHFFEAATDFAWAFRYRTEADLKSQDHEKARIESEPDRKAHRAHVLSLWRSMKGMKPSEKVHRIQEAMKLEGRDYRYKDVEAIVSIAIQDEKSAKECSEKGGGLTVSGQSANPDGSEPRVRLVSSKVLQAHCRKADPSRRHDAAPPSTPPDCGPKMVRPSVRIASSPAHRGG